MERVSFFRRLFHTDDKEDVTNDQTVLKDYLENVTVLTSSTTCELECSSWPRNM